MLASLSRSRLRFVLPVAMGFVLLLSTLAGAETGLPAAPVGYLGCSQTTGSVRGYHDAGGLRFWPVIEYGGGSVSRWANPHHSERYWADFDQARRAQIPGTVWWQICITGNGVEANYNAARAVLSVLRRRVGSTPIYVSAQNGYIDPHVCGIGPPNGPDTAAEIAARLVASDGVLRGPTMSDLRGPDSAGDGPIQTEDGCHPNELGRARFGANLQRFFG